MEILIQIRKGKYPINLSLQPKNSLFCSLISITLPKFSKISSRFFKKQIWYVVEDMMLKLGAGIAGIHHKGVAAALFLDGRRNFAQK
jgi:presenilin-like A22 family membrane protease